MGFNDVAEIINGNGEYSPVVRHTIVKLLFRTGDFLETLFLINEKDFDMLSSRQYLDVITKKTNQHPELALSDFFHISARFCFFPCRL